MIQPTRTRVPRNARRRPRRRLEARPPTAAKATYSNACWSNAALPMRRHRTAGPVITCFFQARRAG
ncbi:MAG: hypothetical protein GC190_07285 [Alphaproteobacteria bacterium]|nr:hypothetical protein [Alphaproteobacteria bacterium]